MTIESYTEGTKFKSSQSSLDRMRREGKTKKDHARGAKRKNEDNKAARASWQGDAKVSFPWSSCNGKRNRYQWTGKGNSTVFANGGKIK